MNRRSLRPSERRYVGMLTRVTPWPEWLVALVVVACGSRSRHLLAEASKHNRHPLDALGDLHDLLYSSIQSAALATLREGL